MRCQLCGTIVSEEAVKSCDEVEDSALCPECYSKITSNNGEHYPPEKNKKKLFLSIVIAFLLIFVIINPAPNPKSYTKLYYLALLITVVMGYRFLEKYLTAQKPIQRFGSSTIPCAKLDVVTISNDSNEKPSKIESPSESLIIISFFSPIIFGAVGFILGIPIAGIFILGFVYIGTCFGSVIGIMASLNWLAQRSNKLLGLIALSINLSTLYYISKKIHLFG